MSKSNLWEKGYILAYGAIGTAAGARSCEGRKRGEAPNSWQNQRKFDHCNDIKLEENNYIVVYKKKICVHHSNSLWFCFIFLDLI